MRPISNMTKEFLPNFILFLESKLSWVYKKPSLFWDDNTFLHFKASEEKSTKDFQFPSKNIKKMKNEKTKQ